MPNEDTTSIRIGNALASRLRVAIIHRHGTLYGHLRSEVETAIEERIRHLRGGGR